MQWFHCYRRFCRTVTCTFQPKPPPQQKFGSAAYDIIIFAGVTGRFYPPAHFYPGVKVAYSFTPGGKSGLGHFNPLQATFIPPPMKFLCRFYYRLFFYTDFFRHLHEKFYFPMKLLKSGIVANVK